MLDPHRHDRTRREINRLIKSARWCAQAMHNARHFDNPSVASWYREMGIERARTAQCLLAVVSPRRTSR